MSIFRLDASFFVFDSGGSAAVSGSLFVNGVPQSFTHTCDTDSCNVGFHVDDTFTLQLGLQAVDGVLFGGGWSVDAADTFDVVLTGPEGFVFEVIVPEPHTAALVGVGMLFLAGTRRPRR